MASLLLDGGEHLPQPAAPRDVAPNAAVAELRNTVAHTMYPDAERQFGPKGGTVLRDLVLAVDPVASAPQVAQRQTELAAIARDVGLNRDDLASFAKLAAANNREPMTDDRRRADQMASIAALRSAYPDPSAYDQALRDAAALTRRDPRLAKLMNTTGIGNAPAVVLRMAELGGHARRNGRLK